MPAVNHPMHVGMLRRWKDDPRGDLYGCQWGDPEEGHEIVTLARDHYLLPLLGPSSTVVEIGPGGGRWTRYMTGCRKVYAVDVSREMLDELARSFRHPFLVPVLGGGTDLAGVPDGCADLVWSYDVFVHLELDAIRAYLKEMWRVLRRGGQGVIHYSDKTKPNGLANTGFSDNDPARMRAAVGDAGFRIVGENVTWNPMGAIIWFERPG